MNILENRHLKLWNPNAVGCWALLFTPIFGSYLLYKNAKQLNDLESQSKAKNWIIAGFAIWIISIFCMIQFPNNTGLTNGFSFWYLILWYFFLVRKQVEKLENQCGGHYLRFSQKEWFISILIGVVFRAILIGLSSGIVLLFMP